MHCFIWRISLTHRTPYTPMFTCSGKFLHLLHVEKYFLTPSGNLPPQVLEGVLEISVLILNLFKNCNTPMLSTGKICNVLEYDSYVL